MVRTATAPEHTLLYIEKFADQKQSAIGLVLGQSSVSHDDIVHLVRTLEDKTAESRKDGDSTSEETEVVEKCSDLKTVKESRISENAKYVTSMLPGGMCVLGIFIVAAEDVFQDKASSTKIKNILQQINSTLSQNKYLYGNPTLSSERIVIHLALDTKKVTAKCIDLSSVASAFKPLELKFNANPLNWQQFDCYYEYDELYPVVVQKNGISVKEQFQQILSSVFKSVESSIVFLDGEQKKESETIESQFKRKKAKAGNKPSTLEILQAIQVSMFELYDSKLPDTVEYLECEGTTHFSGIVASRVYLNVKTIVKDAIDAIKQDVIRSLTTRFTMHCDALIDDKLLPEEKVCFNEPPRRVLVRLPGNDVLPLYFCDYLFPGESPAEALVSVKEMLDINVTEDNVVHNVETPADTSEFDALDKEPTNEETAQTPQNTRNHLYGVGIGLSLFVLLLALALQYYFAPGILFS